MRAALLLAASLPLAAQVFTLGTPADPCTGGSPLVIAGSTLTTRWGDFTCDFPVVDGLYTIRMDFLEPCADAGACAAGQATGTAKRVQNVYVQDAPSLSSFNPSASGATSSVSISRTVLAYAAGGKISIRVQTVLRSGVLAGVTLTPMSGIVRNTCIGKGTDWNCTGVELWAVTTGGITRYYSAVAADVSVRNKPDCPNPDPTSKLGCWQRLAISDPPAPGVRTALIVVQSLQ